MTRRTTTRSTPQHHEALAGAPYRGLAARVAKLARDVERAVPDEAPRAERALVALACVDLTRAGEILGSVGRVVSQSEQLQVLLDSSRDAREED